MEPIAVTQHQNENALHALLKHDGMAWTLWTKSVAGMAFVDKLGVLTAANPKLAAILGYSEAELIGKHFREITLSADVAADEEMFRQLMAGERDSYSMVKTYLTKHGQRVTARLVVHRIGDQAEIIWSQVQPIDTLSIDSLTPEDEKRVASMLLGRLLVQNWKTVALVAAVLLGIARADRIVALLGG